MKKILLLFLCINLQVAYARSVNSLNNDQKTIDSLKILFSTAKSDSLRCVVGFNLAKIYFKNNNIKQYKLFLRKANILTKNNTYLKDIAYYYKTIHLDAPINNPKAIAVFKQAHELADSKLKKYNNKEILSIRCTILYNIAMIYQKQNNDLNAIKIILNQAIPLAKKANDPMEMANMYRFLAVVFYNKNDLEKASFYTKTAIATLEQGKKFNFTEELLEFYLFSVEILSRQKKQNLAIVDLEKATRILKKFPDSNLIIEYYVAKATLEQQTKNYKKALVTIEKGLEKTTQDNDIFFEITLKILKFEILKDLKKYQEAKNLMLEMINEKNFSIEDKKNFSKDLSDIYKTLGDFPNALKYNEQFIYIRDSLDKISSQNQLTFLEAKFNNAENQNKIKQLKIQKDKMQLLAQNSQLKYIVLGLISIVLFVIIVFILIQLKNKNKLAQATTLKNKQEIQVLKNQKQIEVMQAIIRGEEAERIRIARDLHDGIGSRLSGLKIQLNNNSVQFKENSNALNEFSKSLSVAIIELRQTAFNLMPETLLKLGLELALNDLCYQLNNKKTHIEFQANTISNTLTSSQQIIIFRIVQELINNALKYANCSNIFVECSHNQNLFLITVEDNGKGFDVSHPENKKGLGLENVKNRVNILAGKFEIHSEKNKGTICNIELLIT